MPVSELMYCVAVTFKMTEQVEQWICIRFCIKLERSSLNTIWMIQKAAAMRNWWLAASPQQWAHLRITSHAEFSGETLNHPGDSTPTQPRFGALWLMAFPKTKITFERKEISNHQWELGKYDGPADGNWGEVPRCLLWRGQRCHFPMYLVSSSIHVSIFHITWLDMFWTDLIVYIKYIAQCLQIVNIIYVLAIITITITITIVFVIIIIINITTSSSSSLSSSPPHYHSCYCHHHHHHLYLIPEPEDEVGNTRLMVWQ